MTRRSRISIFLNQLRRLDDASRISLVPDSSSFAITFAIGLASTVGFCRALIVVPLRDYCQ